MHSEVTIVPVLISVTSIALLLISLWIVVSCSKMYSRQSAVSSNDVPVKNCMYFHNFESVAEEIYDAAKNSDCEESVEKCVSLLRLYPGLVNTPVTVKKFTPFLRACWTGSTLLVKYMLENGADVSQRTSVGESAFFLAVHKVAKDKCNWDPSLLKLLYKSGCCVNARRNHGYSPLHVAAFYGHVLLIGWLLSYGADPSASAVCGLKPVDLAIANGHTAVVEMLTVRVNNGSRNGTSIILDNI